MQLIAASDPNPIIADILYNFKMIVDSFMQFIATMGDIAYKMIMETGQLGKALRDLVQKVCEFLRDVYADMVQPMICFIREAILSILDAFGSVISGLSTFLGGALNSFSGSVTQTRKNLASSLNCDVPNPFTCTGLFPPYPDAPSSLPMPTRCVQRL